MGCRLRAPLAKNAFIVFIFFFFFVVEHSSARALKEQKNYRSGHFFVAYFVTPILTNYTQKKLFPIFQTKKNSWGFFPRHPPPADFSSSSSSSSPNYKNEGV